MCVGAAPSRGYWFLCLLALSSATLLNPRDPRHLQLDADWGSPLERSHAPETGHHLYSDGDFLMEAESYDQDEEAAAAAAAARAMRSARRCIRHQQSCLGLPLPCCDACDTCYCRFFNAICYCRRVGHACPART